MPLVRPATLMGDIAPLTETAPGLHVAVKPVIALPPLLAGAVKAMLAAALAGVAVPMVGAPGTVRGVTSTDADCAPVPALLVAATVQATVVPLLKPETVIGEDGPLETAVPQVAM